MSDSNDQSVPNGQPEWHPPVPGSTWEPGTAPAMPPPEPMIELVPASVQKSARRRWLAIGGAGALLAAGAFAIASLTGGGAKGGADSPELAIQGLVDSLNNEDIIGAMDFVLPGERRVLKDPLIEMVQELTRLEVFSDKAKLDKVDGFDIAIDLALVEIDDVADDIKVVDLTGTSTITIDQGSLPMGDFLIDTVAGGEQQSGTETTTTKFGGNDEKPPRFATVRRDGRWYVSMFYSIAEAVRGDAEMPSADKAVTPIGAETPQGAVENMLDAIEETDIETMIGVLNPDEASALQRYAPIFLNDAQDQIKQFVDDGGVKIRITGTEFDAQVDGDKARVTITALSAKATFNGESGTVEIADECVTISVPGVDSQKSCADEANAQLEDLGLGSLASLSKESAMTVSKVDGKWYVSPVGTIMDGLLAVMKAIDRQQIEEMIDSLSGFGGLAGMDDSGSMDPFGDTQDPLSPDETLDTMFDDTFDSVDPNEPYVIVSDCLSGEGSNDSAGCLAAAVADGRISETDIPVGDRFPECGMGGDFYSVVYSATDAEFTELITAAGACFADLVAQGKLDEFEVPYDAIAPECFAGKNPYVLEGDAVTKVYEEYASCISG